MNDITLRIFKTIKLFTNYLNLQIYTSDTTIFSKIIISKEFTKKRKQTCINMSPFAALDTSHIPY